MEVQDMVGSDDVGEAAGSAPDRDWEAEARKGGWKPEEEFGEGERRPASFKDAETFVKDAEEVAGFQKKKIKAMEIELQRTTRLVSKLMKSEQNAIEEARAQILREMESAVEIGDVAAHRKAQERMNKLDEKPAGPSPDEVQDEFQRFCDDNGWYVRGNLATGSELEAKARIYADSVADRMQRQGMQNQMSPADFFAAVREQVLDRYPSMNEDRKPSAPKPASAVAGVTRSGVAKAKTGAALPPDAKRTAERYVRMGVPGFKGKSHAEAYDVMAKSWDWN